MAHGGLERADRIRPARRRLWRLGSADWNTWEEVLAIPVLAAAELLEYLDNAIGVLSPLVRALSPEAPRHAVPWIMDGKLSNFQWIKSFYKGFQAHVGEILAIKALMRSR